jgi:hypothetical protein
VVELIQELVKRVEALRGRIKWTEELERAGGGEEGFRGRGCLRQLLINMGMATVAYTHLDVCRMSWLSDVVTVLARV